MSNAEMKFVQVQVHFEYTDIIDAILDRHGISQFARYPLMEGSDRDGKHYGTQVFPGNFTIFQAQVPQQRIDALFADLERFRTSKPAHLHLQAIVMPIERRLNAE
ncbi:MAG TPA: hypothetical protein PK098_09650 [Phycisphaerales bacterium]|nr:hypothetical protein [Phycisphaerales bacterium]